ncbi:MAG: hypothetical protein ACR2GH_09445 [Pseudonocardia sp.]
MDTTAPASEFVANTIANSAQCERQLIAQRNREGFAVKRSAEPAGSDGETTADVREFRPQSRRDSMINVGEN